MQATEWQATTPSIHSKHSVNELCAATGCATATMITRHCTHPLDATYHDAPRRHAMIARPLATAAYCTTAMCTTACDARARTWGRIGGSGPMKSSESGSECVSNEDVLVQNVLVLSTKHSTPVRRLLVFLKVCRRALGH